MGLIKLVYLQIINSSDYAKIKTIFALNLINFNKNPFSKFITYFTSFVIKYVTYAYVIKMKYYVNGTNDLFEKILEENTWNCSRKSTH